MYRLRLFWWLLLLTGGLMVAGLRQDMAASDETAVYSGVAQIPGPLQLDLSITPPIAAPGNNLTLTVRLLNHTQVTYTPQVSLQLPANIQPEMALLPAGATINLQTNSLNWLPIVLANGGEQVVSLPLRIETADLTQPEQVITAVLSYDKQSFTASTTIWVGLPPQITNILSPPQAAVGLPIQLQAVVAGSTPTTQSWQLGDGRRVNVTNPIIVYPAAGMYEITLEASNPLATASHTQLIHIVPHPAAQFVPDDDTPEVGQVVNFLNQSGGQPPITYLWDFGDGSTADFAAPSHAYTAPGIYQVHLTIQNAFGQSEAFWTILVNSAPLAEMSLPESGQVGQPIIGQAYGDESVQTFHWDMGDGHNYDSNQIQHIYTQTGDYYVTLVAYNDFGGTQIGRWIHIDPGFLNIFLPVVFKTAEENTLVDPYGLDLEPVELAAPFVLTPIPMPEGSTTAEQLFIYINEARRHFSLQPLNYQYNLSTAAQQHTDDMAAFGYTAHNGSDGSFPAERLLWMGYNAGYAGEATAWGFEHPYQAVEFWVNSPAHRRIILNQYATEVGVGFTVDYAAPNVWYWTAEFGNAYAPVTQPLLRVGEPLADLETMITTPLTFSWNWPIPLQTGQQFTVYLLANGRSVSLGSVAQPFWGTRYELETAAYGKVTLPELYEWQVKLETNNQPVVVSELRPIILLEDPSLPTPTPVIIPSPSPTPTATPTVTPTPTVPWPTDTPPPPPPTPVILVTATPQP